uniref:Ig-like domain-containing protein n=1 Tax=Dromaius novaehollandiae TaxID=8790 RepID=A0A8C4KXF6_DRONO
MEGHYLPAKNIGSALKITLLSSSFMPPKCRTVASTPLRYPMMWGSALVLPKLENVTSILKGSAFFQCIIAGAQPLSVSWIKDEKILEEDKYHHITFENGVATLQLTNVDLSHRGRYTCQAKNESGIEKCFALLFVQGVYAPLSSSWRITERDPVTLECTVEGTPELRIRWYKDGKHFENNVASFRIEPVSKEDSGTYGFKVENDFGSSTCEAVLTVLGLYFTHFSSFLGISVVTEYFFPLKNTEPPSFLVKPESQQVIPDSTVEFKTTLKGTPPFTVKWFKEDLELVSGPTCFIGIEGSTGFLTLYSVDTSRSGHYTCHISNDVGSDSCTTTLMVTGVHSFSLCCCIFVHFFSFLFAESIYLSNL